MRIVLVLLMFIGLISINSYGQGTNNDFEYDNTDFKYLFSKLGYGVFKFPVKQNKDQIFDIVVEEYRDKKLTSRKTAIEITNEAFKDFGIDGKQYAKPKMDSTQVDSVYFHRFYTERNDTVLTINVKTHGITAPIKFDIKDLAVGDERAKYETKEEIDKENFLEIEEEKLLPFFYANNDEDKPLWCPAGMPKEKIIENFYYAVFVYIKEID